MSEGKGILVVGEIAGGKLAPVTLELLHIGRKLAAELGEELGVVFAGSNLDDATVRETFAYGGDQVYVIDNPLLGNYQPDIYVNAMQQVCRDLKPGIVLLGQTSLGRDLAPRLAFRLGVGLVTDCVKLEIDRQSGLLVCTKPVYGGNALASLVSEAKPRIATMRVKSIAAADYEPSRTGEIIALDIVVEPAVARTRVIARTEGGEGPGKKLESADVVICGGRGIGSAENFACLEELAQLLNGAVGSTRPPCDLGWVSPELQIGLSGKVVAPALYIAVALSGSSAHIAGFGNSQCVIAINNDPYANIFRVAHYGIVGDFRKVVPAIIENWRQMTSGQVSD